MTLENKEKIETLKHTMDRYDHYYDSVNNKGNLYLTLGTFILGGIITGYYAIKETLIGRNDILLFVWLSLICCLLSIFFTLWAIIPYLSGKTNSQNASALFFGDVSNISFQRFKQLYLDMNDETRYQDYLKQVHLLALGLQKKFLRLRISTYLLGVSLFCILIIGFKILK